MQITCCTSYVSSRRILPESDINTVFNLTTIIDIRNNTNLLSVTSILVVYTIKVLHII